MINRLNELLTGKLSKSPAVLKEYATLIGNQYAIDYEEANKMWESVINAYGANDYYFSILRMRNEIAHVIGMQGANGLLISDINRVRNWLSATKGNKSYKIYELCLTLIIEGKSEKAMELFTLLDDGNSYFDNVERVFYYFQKDVLDRENYEKNLVSGCPISTETTLDRKQVTDFMKMCAENNDDSRLVGIGEKWYFSNQVESKAAEKEIHKKVDMQAVRSLFPEVDPEMADVVLEVASECSAGTRRAKSKYATSIKFDIDFTSMFENFVREDLKKNFPELSTAEIEDYIAENHEKWKQDEALDKAKWEEEQAREKEKREELKKSIRAKINNDPDTGYQLAYQLCGDIDTKETRSIRYRLHPKISGLSVGQKIDICEKYASDLLLVSPPSVNQLSSLYLDIIKIILEDNEKVFYEDVDKYYKLASQYAADEFHIIIELINFCEKHCLKTETDKWRERLLEVSLSKESAEIDPRYFIKSGFDFGDYNRLTDIIKKIDYSGYGVQEVIYKLIDKKYFDLASETLDRYENYQISKKTPTEFRIFWIESIRYRMQYYRRGYTFDSLWTSIPWYDNLQSSKRSSIAKMKKKYAESFKKHREYITDMELYRRLPSDRKEEFYEQYIEACKAEILVVPELIAFVREFKSLADNIKDIKNQANNTYEILNSDIYELLRCQAFKDLAMYYEKKNMYSEAISICDMAISCGYESDGTKSGMKGRKERILKKQRNCSR